MGTVRKLKRLKVGRVVALIAAAIVLFAGFQNCSRAPEFSGSQESGDKSSLSGGGTYDGKPRAGTYLRYLTEGCPSATEQKITGVMNITAEDARITNDLCIPMNYSASFNDQRLDYSVHNPDFIGFNSAIFEFKDPAVITAPAPVELWCRFADGSRGLDVVVRPNILSGGTEAWIYAGTNLSSSSRTVYPRQSLAVTKVQSAQAISITSAQNDLELTVDLTSRAGATYAGRARVTSSGQAFDVQSTCRVAAPEPAVYSVPSTLVRMYQFEKPATAPTNGTQAIDSSANTLAGTLHNPDNSGASFVSGSRGRGLFLDGVDDWAELSGLSSAVTNAFTVSAWIKRDVINHVDAVVFAIHSPTGATKIKFGTGMCAGVDDGARLGLKIGTTCTDTNRDVVDGQWHQVILAVGGGSATVFLDGEQVSQIPFTFTSEPADRWSLGVDFDGALGGDRWRGSVDEVVIWSSTLTAAQARDSSN